MVAAACCDRCGMHGPTRLGKLAGGCHSTSSGLLMAGKMLLHLPPSTRRWWARLCFMTGNPTRGTMELSAYTRTPRALSRKALKEIFAYPFDRAGCQMVKLSVDPGNETMRDIASRIGFTEHRIPRGRARGNRRHFVHADR